MGPPGNPRSAPHPSRRYCDSARSGSSASAVRLAVSSASPTTSATTGLRKILEPLNDHFDVATRYRRTVAEEIQVDADRFGPGGRHTGGEVVARDRRAGGQVR